VYHVRYGGESVSVESGFGSFWRNDTIIFVNEKQYYNIS